MSRNPLPRLSRVLTAFCLGLLFTVVAAAPASAHASLLRADPATGGSLTDSPNSISLWFSEPVELQYSKLDVLRTDGSRVPAGDLVAIDGAEPGIRLELSDELDDGGYTVVWSTLSAVDAHVSEGFFSFSVGDAGLPTAADEAALARTANDATVPFSVDAAVRWLNLLGQAAIAGTLIFLAAVLLPVTRRDERALPAAPYRRLLWSTFALLLAGHLSGAIVQTMNATRSRSLDAFGEPLLTLLTDTRYGAIWLARTALLAALALLLWSLTRRERLPSPAGTARLHWGAALLSAALVLLTTSLGSHAAARGGSASVAVANDWLHLLGTSVWVGGLLAFAVSLPILRAGDAGALRAVLARFSAVAIGAVGVLVVTGIIAARSEVVDWDGIIATRYGMWFALKLVLVAATLGFGAYHLLVVRPAIEHGTGMRFSRSLAAEALLAIVVIAATGLLTASIPARDLLNRGDEQFGITHLSTNASVTLRASPGQIGTNELSVIVSPIEPDSFGPVDRVYLRFALADGATTGQSPRVELRQAGPNDAYTFVGTGAYIALEGNWNVQATIRRAGMPDLDIPFEIVATEAGFSPTGMAPSEGEASGPSSAMIALGSAWLLAGIALAVAGWQTRSRGKSLSWGLMGLALLTVSFGSVLLLVSGSG